MIGALIGTSRPVTGVFAAVLVIIGFRFFPAPAWPLASITSISFLAITWSIMSVNDLVDREHDRRKGKTFASAHIQLVVRYCIMLGAIVVLFIGLIAMLDRLVALYCACVWGAGLCYSLLRRWYPVQNLVVALCSAAPLMAASIHYRAITIPQILLGISFIFTILIRELVKDLEDRAIDVDYKMTVPVKAGPLVAVMNMITWNMLWAGCLALYPHLAIKLIGLIGGTVTQVMYAQLFTAVLTFRPEPLAAIRQSIDWVIRTLLFAVFVIQTID